MKNTITKNAVIFTAALLSFGISGEAGVISYVQITNDADSGISTANTYTHTLDFGNSAFPIATINGVAFNGYNVGANGTLDFSMGVEPSGVIKDTFANANHNVTGSLANLMTDMYFVDANGNGGESTWTLSGLTAGVTYDTRIYARTYGNVAGTRNVTIVFDPDGAGGVSDSTGSINEDNATGTPPGFANFNDAYYINYRFTAVAGQDLVITATQVSNGASWHLYGLSNQVAVPEPSTLALLGAGGVMLLAARMRRFRADAA